MLSGAVLVVSWSVEKLVLFVNISRVFVATKAANVPFSPGPQSGNRLRPQPGPADRACEGLGPTPAAATLQCLLSLLLFSLREWHSLRRDLRSSVRALPLPPRWQWRHRRRRRRRRGWLRLRHPPGGGSVRVVCDSPGRDRGEPPDCIYPDPTEAAEVPFQ